MPQAARKLNVIIVGGGLGGLATGLALQTDGHTVTVLDAAPEFAEVSCSFRIGLRIYSSFYGKR